MPAPDHITRKDDFYDFVNTSMVMTQRYFDLRRSIYLNTNSFMKYVWEHTQTPVTLAASRENWVVQILNWETLVCIYLYLCLILNHVNVSPIQKLNR